MKSNPHSVASPLVGDDRAPPPPRPPLLKPQASSLKPSACYLSPFTPDFAPLVASWVRTAQELTWLAPGTPPPVTAEKVAAWGEDRKNRYLFWANSPSPYEGEGRGGVSSPSPTRAGVKADLPAGYAELNEIPNQPAHLWIGHFLIDPSRRGRSLGVRFAQALLARAFVELAAREVVLVVFPDNKKAIRCYERAGMLQSGHERKFFKATNAEHQFLRMAMTRTRFHRLAASGRIEGRPLPLCSITPRG
ncbi:MAG TPA: GNAT family protein [Phycisphaerae bacterium]|nr:GNAT family protein [Phycisphaerae bacterium]